MFNYVCEKCGQGKVRKTSIKNLVTRFDGIPFTVPKAFVGVCDRCGAKHYNSQEWKRWRSLFQQAQLSRGNILSAAEIRALRKEMGHTVAAFSQLIGCSRQSLYYWESTSRKVAQARMADLMIKLVRESCSKGSLNVIDFLYREAASIGIRLPLLTSMELPGDLATGGGKRSAEGDLVYKQAGRYDSLFSHSSQPPGFSPCINAVA